jgi:hypothetical protein
MDLIRPFLKAAAGNQYILIVKAQALAKDVYLRHNHPDF